MSDWMSDVCSSDRVRNERTDLNRETIAKLGARFGPECLDPWSACFGGRNVPKEASDHRISLTAVTGSLHKLSLATDEGSKGGVAITHCELADMLPDLKATQRLVNSLIARAERLGTAACPSSSPSCSSAAALLSACSSVASLGSESGSSFKIGRAAFRERECVY